MKINKKKYLKFNLRLYAAREMSMDWSRSLFFKNLLISNTIEKTFLHYKMLI